MQVFIVATLSSKVASYSIIQVRPSLYRNILRYTVELILLTA